MARGLWKGAISFGLVNVPVELISAEKKPAEIDLTMLDKRDLAPVGYKQQVHRRGRALGGGVMPQDDVNGALQQKVTAKEIEMALRLIDDMSEKWRPEKFNLMALLRRNEKPSQTRTQGGLGEK
jgi:non-homologous end joining protein Ku